MHSQPGRRNADTIDYIQSMLGQLRTMAEIEQCDMLAYLIEMAYVEAGDILSGSQPSQVANQQRHSAS
ncbi:hypothetical protein [Mesorhizobium marinum]|uniref:Uncharacterized protein n=1 Tax=Mesorhizobium marinum TaxID=3228790 RepID=A0ABV3R539_9HYPH